MGKILLYSFMIINFYLFFKIVLNISNSEN
jgi:hypothetical protein